MLASRFGFYDGALAVGGGIIDEGMLAEDALFCNLTLLAEDPSALPDFGELLLESFLQIDKLSTGLISSRFDMENVFEKHGGERVRGNNDIKTMILRSEDRSGINYRVFMKLWYDSDQED